MKTSKRFISLLLAVIAILAICIPVFAADDEVVVGGCLFGVKIFTDGVPVVGIEGFEVSGKRCAPAHDAGIKIRDVIKSVNGRSVGSSADIIKAITSSDGEEVRIILERGGTEKEFTVKPMLSGDGVYRIGLWLRDSAAGIGTVTYVDPKTYEFGGLGHGICDTGSMSLLPMLRGVVSDVALDSVVKGQSGVPGELKGSFKGGKIGALVGNKHSGVYGVFSRLPSELGERMKLGDASTVTEGVATIRCSVSGRVQDYEVKISKINHDSDSGKNFVIEVTDPALLSITGGIVQGMSGSPIIQHGKLIGAVTHVLINDPTKGYGIFVEKMMNGAA